MESKESIDGPRVAAVVLNWNSAADTLECVAALRESDNRESDNPRLNIIIVDNGSTDSSWEKLQQNVATDVTLIQSGANLGYAGGNNIGIRAALDHQSEYVWIINNDALVDPLCLNELLETARRHQQAGVFVPKILYKDRPHTLWYAGGNYDRARAQAVHWGLGEQDDGYCDASCKITFATGCSLFVRSEVFGRLGLLDDKYFLYWEDVQFSHRVLHAGYEICYVPTARVWHQAGASSGQHEGGRSPTYHYYMMRNRLWYIREHHNDWTKYSAYVWTIPLTLRRVAGIVVRRENVWFEKLEAVARGLRDGMLRYP